MCSHENIGKFHFKYQEKACKYQENSEQNFSWHPSLEVIAQFPPEMNDDRRIEQFV